MYTHFTERQDSEPMPMIHWIVGDDPETLACGQDRDANEGSYLVSRATCPECRRYAKRVVSVEIVMSNFYDLRIVAFHTGHSFENDTRGRRYRHVSNESMRRLTRVLYEMALPCFYDYEEGTITFGRKE